MDGMGGMGPALMSIRHDFRAYIPATTKYSTYIIFFLVGGRWGAYMGWREGVSLRDIV